MGMKDLFGSGRAEIGGEAPTQHPHDDEVETTQGQETTDMGERASRLRTVPDVDYRTPEGEEFDDPDPSVTQPISPSDSGVHALPDPVRDPSVLFGHKVDCEACSGHGYVIVSTRDLLRESSGLLDDSGAEIVRDFYGRLLDHAPELAALFPADLLTDDAIKGQREKLLGALKSLASLYDPDNPEAMQRLTTALQAFGRSHADFQRPDGSRRGATFDEYAAVKLALFETLRQAAGAAWKPAYGDAWAEAYDFAAVTMLAEQYRTVVTIPRQPRQSASEPLRGAVR